MGKLLFPLDAFYERAGLIVPRVSEIPGEEVPEPYHGLLVHNRDMTPTLEAYFGDRIHLKVVGRRLDGDSLSRLVVLTLNQSLRHVEFGAITIHLDQFPGDAREAIMECRRPLGSILADFNIVHASRPHAFLRLASDPLIKGALDLTGTAPLYGRRNSLLTPEGSVLADVLEILPLL